MSGGTDLETVRVETASDGVATLSLNNPPVNALGQRLVGDLRQAVKILRADPTVRCVVVRSAGEHFCAGADLKEREGMNVEQVRAFVPQLSGAVNDLAALPMPTLAAVRGAAAGGGCELALACDLRILSADARIGLRETALAILPGAGGTQRLPRIAGSAVAKRWIFTARLFGAEEARADRVADRVVPPEQLDEAAAALASEIAANGPVALRLAKKAMEDGWSLPMAEALQVEWEAYQGVLDTRDREEALQAFKEKRRPRFQGR